MDLKLDFILNHASVLSEQFQDIIENGEESKYKDFFINWNKFWEGHGTMTEEEYIQPDQELIKNMFFRKPGLPILMVRFPDGKNVPYWNTFYQEVKYPVVDAQDIMKAVDIQYYSADEIVAIVNKEIAAGNKPGDIDFGKYEAYKPLVVEYMESNRKYLGQMDLNIKSPMVWDFYDGVLKQLSNYGAKIVRLHAFAYAPKELGEKNFFMPGKPQIWYLDLFAGKNDHEAVKRAGAGGHKEINRTNLTKDQIQEVLTKGVVKKQLEMLRFRKLFHGVTVGHFGRYLLFVSPFFTKLRTIVLRICPYF